ncbi:hypothetical protein BKA69DRAFT_432273 [Paraphysoderma sedebokerense]|nr:hypothetical protein BKA69DRAFT_432273 [Paraphysoderma sedebokerense]
MKLVEDLNWPYSLLRRNIGGIYNGLKYNQTDVYTFRGPSQVDDTDLEFQQRLGLWETRCQEVYDAVLASARRILGADRWPITDGKLQVYWVKYLRWFHYVLSEIEANNARTTTNAVKLKTFLLFPHTVPKMRYITIDTRGLYYLLKAYLAENIGGVRDIILPRTRENWEAEKRDWWMRIFPGIQKILTSKKSFNDMIMTDGCGVSVVVDNRPDEPKRWQKRKKVSPLCL